MAGRQDSRCSPCLHIAETPHPLISQPEAAVARMCQTRHLEQPVPWSAGMGHSLYAEGSGCSGRGDCLTTESGGGSDPRGSLDHQRGGLRVLALFEMASPRGQSSGKKGSLEEVPPAPLAPQLPWRRFRQPWGTCLRQVMAFISGSLEQSPGAARLVGRVVFSAPE